MQNQRIAATARLKGRAVDRVWRFALLLTILGVHALLFLWLATRYDIHRVAARTDDSLITISLIDRGASSASRNYQRPAKPAAMPPVADQAPPGQQLTVPSPPAAEASGNGAHGPVGACILASEAGQAIMHDAAAMTELDALPHGIRSSADAVMLWNGQWLSPGPSNSTFPAGALRKAVEQVVLRAPSDCRNTQITGPQFVQVPEAGRTVMIVIGSGSWRWADLLSPSSQCTGATAADCDRLLPSENDEKADLETGKFILTPLKP